MEIVDKLNRETTAALADPKMKARLADLGRVAMAMSLPISATSSPTSREMGQGDPGGKHQGRVVRLLARRHSINSVPRTVVAHHAVMRPVLGRNESDPVSSNLKGCILGRAAQIGREDLDQVADAVICTNHSGTIIRWNYASTALFGHSAEEALGQSVELIIPEHLRAAHWSGFDTAMTKGVTKLRGRPTLTRALHKSGRRLYVEMSFAIVKGDTESEVLGAVPVARDVTERVERERAASRSS